MQQDPTGQPLVTEGSETPGSGATAANDDTFSFDFEAAFSDNGGQTTPPVSDSTAPNGHSGQPSGDGASTSNGTTTTAAPAAGEQTTDGAGAAASTPAPSTPGQTDPAAAQSEPGRRLSKREQDQAEIARLSAEKTDLAELVKTAVADAETAKEEAARVKREADERAETQRVSAEAYSKLIGPQDEYDRRTRISNLMRDPYYSGERLDDEQVEELGKWTATRELRQPFMADADKSAAKYVTEQLDGQRALWAQQALLVADEIGLPREVLANPSNANLASLLKATAESTATRIRAAEVKPLQDRISQLEGYASGLETSVVHGQKVPPIGGNSDGGLFQSESKGWNPDADWGENLAGSPAGARS